MFLATPKKNRGAGLATAKKLRGKPNFRAASVAAAVAQAGHDQFLLALDQTSFPFFLFTERKSLIGPDTAAASPGSCLRVRLRRVSRDSLKLSLAQAGGCSAATRDGLRFRPFDYRLGGKNYLVHCSTGNVGCAHTLGVPFGARGAMGFVNWLMGNGQAAVRCGCGVT